MEVELNTSNLRKLCRICFGAGEYNVWDHKVNWSNSDEGDPNSEDETITESITLHEVLEMYNDWEHSVLEIDDEIQMICKECINELQPHYRYYKRLCAVNTQMKQLYEEALQQEANKTSMLQKNQTTIDQVEYEYDNNLQDCVDYIEDTQPAGQYVLVGNIKKTSAQTHLLKQAQKRKFTKTPKFILTGGVTQLLTHATGATSLDLPVDSTTQITDTHTLLSPNKRKRKEVIEMPAVVDEIDNSHNNLLRQHNAHRITKKRATIEDQTTLVTAVEEVPLDLPPHELLKTDYVTSEQMQELVTNNDTEEIQPEIPTQTEDINDELAALPYSTLSADDAGRSIYVCKYCPQAFTAPCFLLTHARVSHVCKHCGEAFVKKTDLFAHVKESHTIYKCNTCGKELSSNSNLRAHSKRMHGSTISDKRTHTVPGHKLTTVNTEERGDDLGEKFFLKDSSHQIMAEYLD